MKHKWDLLLICNSIEAILASHASEHVGYSFYVLFSLLSVLPNVIMTIIIV